MKKYLMFIWLCGVFAAAEAAELERIDTLVKGGAPNLALRLMDAQQAGLSDREEWMRWERRRMGIYASQGNWPAIVARAERLADGLPEQFVAEMWLKAAQAQLSAGNGAGARRFLRRLLWGHHGDGGDTAPWREMVVRSYLVEDAVADAVIAVRRYRKEFGLGDSGWNHLHARVLIRAGDYASAARQVAQKQTYAGRFLYLLARLRGKEYAPEKVIKKGKALEKQTRKRKQINRRVWALLAEAAAGGVDPVLRMAGLEHALPMEDRLFDIRADDLWKAYEAYAEVLGNKEHLLIGDDEVWLKRAGKLEKKSPRRSRAIYALLAARSEDREASARVHRSLLESLYGDGYEEAARLLYTASSRYPDYRDLPPVVRYFLSEKALRAYDYPLAARLVQGLEEPPPGVDPERWQLRRARLAIYTGEYMQGVELINKLLAQDERLADDEAGRVLQVVFDLQKTGNNAEAYTLFDRIHGLVESKRLKRETLFWMAESLASDDRHEAAAELYLRSAVYKQPQGADMWGQTARYHAADSLAKAGLADDAQDVYSALLKLTSDPERRALIERKIQELWLLGPPLTTP